MTLKNLKSLATKRKGSDGRTLTTSSAKRSASAKARTDRRPKSPVADVAEKTTAIKTHYERDEPDMPAMREPMKLGQAERIDVRALD